MVQVGNTAKAPIKFGKYSLLDRISHGGMAEVFRAKTFGAAGFERTVAIKLLLPTVAMDRDFVTMLIDEAKIAGQLNHANIAQIFDLGMAEGRYYIVQEYVNGRDIRAVLKHLAKTGQKFSVAQACHVLLKTCEGLEYAHNKRDAGGQPLNLVHRDVSPQNIVVSREGEVKLIDFGIAKAEGRATRTLAGLVKGKFAYMSPEQIRGLPVDRRSDVFACGIVLHELLTGRPLFRRKSEFETLKRARSAEIEPPSTHNPDVPAALDKIVLRALARHVEDRYQASLALRDELWDFVRQSGNFYSRNELAAWMRQQFGASEQEATDADPSIEVQAPQSAEHTVVDGPDQLEQSGEIAEPSTLRDLPSNRSETENDSSDLVIITEPPLPEYLTDPDASSPGALPSDGESRSTTRMAQQHPDTTEQDAPPIKKTIPYGAKVDIERKPVGVVDLSDPGSDAMTVPDDQRRGDQPSARAQYAAQYRARQAEQPAPVPPQPAAQQSSASAAMDVAQTTPRAHTPASFPQLDLEPGAPLPVSPSMLAGGGSQSASFAPAADAGQAARSRSPQDYGPPPTSPPQNTVPVRPLRAPSGQEEAIDDDSDNNSRVLVAVAILILLLAGATSITLAITGS